MTWIIHNYIIKLLENTDHWQLLRKVTDPSRALGAQPTTTGLLSVILSIWNDSVIVAIIKKFCYERHICVRPTKSQQPITTIRNIGLPKLKIWENLLPIYLVYCLVFLYFFIMKGHRCIVPGCKSGYDSCVNIHHFLTVLKDPAKLEQ